MKFYSNQLPQLISKIASGSVKALLLYGYNRGFIDTVVREIAGKLSLLTVSINAKDATVSNLSLQAASNNFFNQRELLKVEYSGSAAPKELKDFLQGDRFENFICFIGDESLPSSGIRKFFEDAQNLAVMGCYYEDENYIARMAASLATEDKKTFSADAIGYLKSVLKGDHLLVKNELIKLINYAHDNSKISYEDVKQALSPELSASGDEMCLYFSKKQPDKFLREVEALKTQAINEVLIIRALIRYYLNLFLVVSKVEEGMVIDLAIKQLSPPIFFKYVNDFKLVAQQFRRREIIRIICILQQAEATFKNNNQAFDFFTELYLRCFSEEKVS